MLCVFPLLELHLFNGILPPETPLVLLGCSVNEITELIGKKKNTFLRLGPVNLRTWKWLLNTVGLYNDALDDMIP